MRYTKLGKAGVKVSRICLGTMNFGSVADEKESFAIMDRALELGVNFFDTSNNYGQPLGYGITEKIIGQWLTKRSGVRNKIVLASKLYCIMGPGPNDRGLSAYHMRRSCTDSLKRLQTDCIDLYQMHHIDRGGPRSIEELKRFGYEKEIEFELGAQKSYSTPWEEIWQGLEQLIREGKIIYTGSCNFAAWNIAFADTFARSRNLFGLVTEQTYYNLAKRMIEIEVIPACKELGLGLLPYSPLEGGVLGGMSGKENMVRRKVMDKSGYAGRVERYENLCEKIGEKPSRVALAWLLHNPVVTAPIIGPRTVEQLEDCVKALDVKLSEDTIKELDGIWPGPGGEAPELYSW